MVTGISRIVTDMKFRHPRDLAKDVRRSRGRPTSTRHITRTHSVVPYPVYGLMIGSQPRLVSASDSLSLTNSSVCRAVLRAKVLTARPFRRQSILTNLPAEPELSTPDPTWITQLSAGNVFEVNTLTIPNRFNGPRSSANGGWFAGQLSALGNFTGPVTVKLFAPPPLDTALPWSLVDDNVVVTDPNNGRKIATAAAAEDVTAPDVPPVDLGTARAAASAYVSSAEHPFETCYSCGPERDYPEGLGLRPGLVPGTATTACVWTPTPENTTADLWSALDCPGGWSVDLAGRPMVLGTITAQVQQVPHGQECVVMGHCEATSDRTASTSATLWAADTLVGWSRAVWVVVDPAVFNALQA